MTSKGPILDYEPPGEEPWVLELCVSLLLLILTPFWVWGVRRFADHTEKRTLPAAPTVKSDRNSQQSRVTLTTKPVVDPDP